MAIASFILTKTRELVRRMLYFFPFKTLGSRRSRFQYAGNLTSVTGPNNDLVTISFGTPGVSKVQFPVEGYDTYFYYIQVASKTVLQSIRHGSGLQSAFKYRTLQYLDSSNQQQLLPQCNSTSVSMPTTTS